MKIKVKTICAAVLAAAVFLTINVAGFTFSTLAAETPKAGDDGTTNWDFIEPVTHLKSVPNGYTGIYTPQDLNNIRANLSGKYMLMNDIDLAAWGNWEPISKNYASAFSGIFDGNGYEIKNITIINNDPSNIYTGLFGFVVNGTIKNLGMAAANIERSIAGGETGGIIGRAENSVINNCFFKGTVTGSHVGGIAGVSHSIIKNCFNEGTINGAEGAGGIACSSYKEISDCYNLGAVNAITDSWSAGAGGIAGDSWLTEIKNCYNEGEITAISTGIQCAGGIAGSADTILNCYNSGRVNAESSSIYSTDSTAAGGIAGIARYYTGYYNYGSKINNCYNTGDVNVWAASCDANVGGIAGYTYDSPISYCYNAGAVSGHVEVNGSLNIGGILGFSETIYSNVSYCYYINNISRPVGSDNILPSYVKSLSESEMKVKTNFYEFDFVNVWGIDPEINDGFPFLRVFEDVPEEETTTATPATTTKPPVTTAKPPATTAKPPVTTTNPPETTAKPVETTAKPPATTVKPFEKTTKKPPETTAKPTTGPETTAKQETTAKPESTAAPVPTSPPVPDKITINIYNIYIINNNMLTGVSAGDTLGDILSSINEKDYVNVFGRDGDEIKDGGAPLATGMKLKLMDGGKVKQELPVVV
ncbi:MAG: hypothetical protein FWF08_03040, partial [Oscillospiraceae bacterium]|nr:hypothetical protein [Oscillospiraceae bacterium]